MQAFEYANPKSVKDAVGLLGTQWSDAAVLAGGTDLLSLMKDYVVTPKRVVNIKDVAELKGITAGAKDLRIGATVTFEELIANPAVRQRFPSLTEAARGVSSQQVRNMGTVGGDLCQRPRDWYFRLGYGLLAVQDGKSLIADGDNRYAAIFDNSGQAKFVSVSSLGPALIALGARVKLQSAAGTREVPVEKFFVVPQSNDAREVALLPNEILTEVLVPIAPAAKNATCEIRQKDALDWPLVTASVAVVMKGANVDSARVVLGQVAPTPYFAAAVGTALQGKPLTAANIQAASDAAANGASPLSMNAYKVQLAKTAVKRALMAAGGVKG